MSKATVKMVTVRYKGKTPIGTLIPRRMWRPGDKAKVKPNVAEILFRNKNFVKSRILKPKKAAKTEDEPQEVVDLPPTKEVTIITGVDMETIKVIIDPEKENQEEVTENPST